MSELSIKMKFVSHSGDVWANATGNKNALTILKREGLENMLNGSVKVLTPKGAVPRSEADIEGFLNFIRDWLVDNSPEEKA